MADVTLLVHPVDGATISLTVDASYVEIGGVLEQAIDAQWRPIAFFIKPLRLSEQKYPPFNRELAAHLAIRHFRHFLEGQPSILYSDHNSLVPTLHKKSGALER